MYSVTRFRNRRLAHVASCQPDIGAWHGLYTSALLWSQDSWSWFFIGTSYKDHQVKRRCVREKFTEWSLEVWMFKFYIKKCYIRRTCSIEKRQNFYKYYLFKSSLYEFWQSMVGSEPRTFRSTSDDVNEKLQRHLTYLGEIWIIYKKIKFSRNFKNPKKFWKFEKNWNSRFQKFEKIDLMILPNRSNRSNRKKSKNR